MLFFFITCFSFILFYKSLPLQQLPPWAHQMRLVSFWFFFITCFSFILFYKSLPLQQLPPWAHQMRLVSFWFFCCKGSSFVRLTKFLKRNFESIPTKMNEAFIGSNINESVEQIDNSLSLLDLPELTLECILERLPPDGLCKMASVCNSLKNRCMSNHLWERHMKQKWGRIIGPAAYREWQWQIATRNDLGFLDRGKGRGFLNFLCRVWPWPLLFIRSKVESNIIRRKNFSASPSPSPSPPVDSIMSWYLALETGKFWFPAQVYNRENGHVGFMLSCYDAELSYDSRTDTFQARYPPHGRRAVAIESGVTWDRLRAPPVDTSPHDLHNSDCLNDLRPGDHIEIQWRRNKEFPYGWWHGVVGHLESCDGNESYCRCHESDMVALEFNQYTPGSRWRNTTLNRKDHHEEGNGADGFYGGIRKLYTLGEISTWKRLWPTDVLE